ncbi:FMN-linked oxidoreductase [Obba rivulosa]|uniref:Dihydroorotate oxidase n=1 Tax=Obba rivulosa TaxID=1052685 RepID=A0A8E2DND4_9APHY|nr:FMN-linked oxidoreductase [Obba rivulosa]
MARIRAICIDPPVMNSSCLWASDLSDLRALYDSPYTGAVTTRTATLQGFNEDESHAHAFLKNSITSINSYGYSPHPLSRYIEWVRILLTTPMADGSKPAKPIIMSITASTPPILAQMVSQIQTLRVALRDAHSSSPPDASVPDPSMLVAVEINTSCPNIPGSPPPAYSVQHLFPFLDVLATAVRADHSLTLGLKLPPYPEPTKAAEVVRVLGAYTFQRADGTPVSPWAFLTCTNTLGNSLVFAEQVLSPAQDVKAKDNVEPRAQRFALPEGKGGLGGDAIHALALGNVHAFAQVLNENADAALREVRVIGVGGVTSPAAAARMWAAGASVVACATLLGKEGVKAFEILAA